MALLESETPEYRVLAKSFFAPDMIEPGTRIRYAGAPNNNLEPLNAAAEAAMEKWFDEEIDEIDPTTLKPTGLKVKPHGGFRFKAYQADEVHTAEILAPPTADDDTIQTLGEIMNARKSTNQRPGPAKAPKSAVVKDLT